MDKIKKLHLKNRMIKVSIIFMMLFSLNALAQEKIVQDFNLDGIKDTLYYKCFKYEENIDGPYCKIEIITGGLKKKYTYNLEYIGDPILDTCGNGCISLYTWTKDTEYTQEYNYSKKYDDWILTVDEQLLKYENDKEESTLPKDYVVGISGKEYPIKRKPVLKKRMQRK